MYSLAVFACIYSVIYNHNQSLSLLLKPPVFCQVNSQISNPQLKSIQKLLVIISLKNGWSRLWPCLDPWHWQVIECWSHSCNCKELWKATILSRFAPSTNTESTPYTWIGCLWVKSLNATDATFFNTLALFMPFLNSAFIVDRLQAKCVIILN